MSNMSIPKDLIITPLKWKYMIRSVNKGKNILLVGPTGSGKTLAIQKSAHVFPERQFFFFSLGATQDARSSLIGNTHYNKEQGTFVVQSLFARAIQVPNAIILLDELSRAHPDAWNILITVLDENQRYLRVDEHVETPTIRVAQGVTFMATANIGREYTSTRVMDRALQDRFSVTIEMDPLTAEEETRILFTAFPHIRGNPIVEQIIAIAEWTRKEVIKDDGKVSLAISSRVTKEMAELVGDGFTLEEIAEVSIYPFYSNAGGVKSERTVMKQYVQKFIPVESPLQI